jgi:hypothetical protein
MKGTKMEEREEKRLAVALVWHARLKEVKSFEDFKKFQSALCAYNCCNPDLAEVELVGKRNGHLAYAFTEFKVRLGNTIQVFHERADYLYDDGVSTGQALWKNLYKVLKPKVFLY